jgi:hypothetical protein
VKGGMGGEGQGSTECIPAASVLGLN